MTTKAEAEKSPQAAGTTEDRMANVRRRLAAVMFTDTPGKGDRPWKPRRYDQSGQEICTCEECEGVGQE